MKFVSNDAAFARNITICYLMIPQTTSEAHLFLSGTQTFSFFYLNISKNTIYIY